MPSTESSDCGSGPMPNTNASAWSPSRTNFPSVALTRLSHTPLAFPGNGVRRIESGTWW